MGILGALIIALMVTLLFSPYKNRNSIIPFVILFLILFCAGFAAQFWIVPFGPILWGVSWFPVLFVVFIFALLFSSPPLHRTRGVTNIKETEISPATIVISVFIWILFLILVAAIIAGLANPASFK